MKQSKDAEGKKATKKQRAVAAATEYLENKGSERTKSNPFLFGLQDDFSMSRPWVGPKAA